MALWPILGLLSFAQAQEPVKISAAPTALTLTPGGTATVRLNFEIAPPYHIYSPLPQLDSQGNGPIPTTVAVQPAGEFSLAGPLKNSAPAKHFDPGFQMDVEMFEGRAWIDVPLKAAAALKPGARDLTLVVSYQACDNQSCLPPADTPVPLKITIGAASASDDLRWSELEKLVATPAATREPRWTETAALAWALFQAHPDDPRRWTAWDPLLRNTPRFTNDADAKRLWAERDALIEVAAAKAKDVPESLRELFAGRKVSALVLPFTNGTLPADWQARLVPPIEKLAAQFPNGSAAFVYFSRLVSAVEAQAPATMPALVERMAASPNARVREIAAKRQLVLNAMTRPLELKFTALDGREVDTTKWRGRVVLVDFWATWCVPCVQAMPHLKELYAKYHDRGLEVVNISVDNANARDALVKLVAKLELPWPQCFDGKAQQGEFAQRYGVQPIPHVLLAGPDGMIVAVNPPAEKLESEIRRLLKL